MKAKVREEFVAHLEDTLGLPAKVGNLYFDHVVESDALYNEEAWNLLVKKIPEKYHSLVGSLRYAMTVITNVHMAREGTLAPSNDDTLSMSEATLDFFKKLYIFRQMSDSPTAVDLLCTNNIILHLVASHGVPIGMAMNWIKEFNAWHKVKKDIQGSVLEACKDLSMSYKTQNILNDIAVGDDETIH